MRTDIELDYAAHVERMKKLTVPVETVAVTFKDDATFYLPFRSYRREAIPLEEKHGEVTQGQIMDIDDLNLVEGDVGTENGNLKMFEYTPEEWNDIQQKIDNGEIVWQH